MKDSVERISNAVKSYLLADLAKRNGMDSPSPDDVVGKGVVRCNNDFLALDEDVEVIKVRNGVCNNEAFEEWEMDEYVSLRELIVGDECFQFVKDLRIVGLNALEKVEIGKQCFCKTSGGELEMRDCAKLESVKIGDDSFVGVVSVVFESECFVDVVME